MTSSRQGIDRIEVRPDLRGLEGYHSPQVDVSVRLNTNESPVGPPEAWKAEYAAALGDLDWNRYPDRAATDLRSAIARWHGVDVDQVFAANGSNEVLQSLLLAFAGPGRRVVVFEPTYQMHAQIARAVGSTVVAGRRGADFRLDVSEVRRVLAEAEPAVVFVCSPNNPTGLVESNEVIDAVVESAPGLVILDEAYAQFADSSALDLIAEDAPLVVTRTFSKTWSMAAARLGYAIGSSRLLAELDKVVLPYHLDAAKQLAGTLAVKYVDEMNDRVAAIVAERERIDASLAQLDVDVVPSGANFILFRPRHVDGHELWARLVELDVLVRDCSRWPGLTNCLRVTVGTPDENSRFLAAMRTALDDLVGRATPAAAVTA